VLGLLVYPSKLAGVAGTGILAAAFLMLAARPAAVFLTLIGSGMSHRERLMVAWGGLRGAVPIILATFPLLAGVTQAERMFDIVFFVVLASALLQGTSIRRWRAGSASMPRWPGFPSIPIECEPGGRVPCDLVDVEIRPTRRWRGKQLVELGLPEGALVVLINRGEEFINPTGGTILNPGDRLLFWRPRRSSTSA
jgi:cell volume regulation protein A